MPVNTATIATSRRRISFPLVVPIVRSTGSILRAVREAWNDVAQAGQLGPDRETEIGRQTGARI